jgi:hypothetical protein
VINSVIINVIVDIIVIAVIPQHHPLLRRFLGYLHIGGGGNYLPKINSREAGY